MTNIQSMLDKLPTVVLEIILESLDFDSIISLRETCRALSQKCIGPRFKTFLRHQKTDLTESSLQSFNALAFHPTLGSAVKSLTILATVYDPSVLNEIISTKKKRSKQENNGPFFAVSYAYCSEEELEQARSDLEWLQKEQEKQQSTPSETTVEPLATILRQLKQLNDVNLDALVVHGPNETAPAKRGEWHPLWIRASQVYRMSMSAIALSQVEVDTLSVYRFTPRVAVPTCDITAHMDQLEKSIPPPGTIPIKNISLRLSARVETDFSKIVAAREEAQGADRVYQEVFGSTRGFLDVTKDPEATSEDNFPGVARLLQKMPDLEAFDLHFRTTVRGDISPYDKVFAAIADEVQLPKLAQCILQGIFLSEESILRFLRNHPNINDLYLDAVHLTSGSWNTILRFLSQEMPLLTRLHLSTLFEQGKLVNLRPADFQERRAEFPALDYFPGNGGGILYKRKFGAEEIKQGLEFNARWDGMSIGERSFVNWIEGYKATYGFP